MWSFQANLFNFRKLYGIYCQTNKGKSVYQYKWRGVYARSQTCTQRRVAIGVSLMRSLRVALSLRSLCMSVEFCPGKFSPPARYLARTCVCLSISPLFSFVTHILHLSLSPSRSLSLSRGLFVPLALVSRSRSLYVNFRANVETVRTVFPCCGWALNASFWLCYILKQYADVRISETQIGTHGKHSMTVCAFFHFQLRCDSCVIFFFGSFAWNS